MNGTGISAQYGLHWKWGAPGTYMGASLKEWILEVKPILQASVAAESWPSLLDWGLHRLVVQCP